MSMSDDDEFDDALAAEYALGLLPDDMRRAAYALSLTDRRFAAEVAAWQEHLASLADEVEPVEPSAAVRKRLLKRLFPPTSRLAGFWRGLGLVSTTAAAMLAVYIAVAPGPTGGELLLTELVTEDESLRVLAAYDPASGHLVLERIAGAAAEGRALELWAIAGDAAPVSLRLLPDDVQRAGLDLPGPLRAVAEGLTLAISDEPPGGSPTGQPTGAVLAVAQIPDRL